MKNKRASKRPESERKAATRQTHQQRAHMDTLNRHGLLSVFVGAGVSQSCGLPGWQTLVARLTDRVPTSKRRFDLDSIKELDLVTRTTAP